MKKSNLFLSFFATIILLSCSSDKDSPEIIDGPKSNSKIKYIIASNPLSSKGVADYLLTTDNITEGKISTIGNGIEQDGSYRYYITTNNKFFSMLYGQSNPGAVTTYSLDKNKNLTKLSDFQSETFQAFTAVDNDILFMKIPRRGEPNASWYRLDSNTSEFVSEGQINVVELADNGERAHFTWLTQVGDKVFAPYMHIKGCCNDVFGTDNPDNSGIAVYKYPSMELEKVIKDSRTSSIGSYFNSGLEVDEKGDAYAFSFALAQKNSKFNSTKKVSITRIKKGTTEFDDYYFDLEAVSEGKFPSAISYLGNGNFIVYYDTEKKVWGGCKIPAIVNVYNKTIKWVSNFPKEEDLTNVARGKINTFLSKDKKKFYLGVTTKEDSAVYEIDTESATAKKGLIVEGGVISAISALYTDK